MKGYELYSWQAGDDWHFALLTGTNRNKTVAEITSPEETPASDGWVNVRVVGVEALKALLGQLPAEEQVFWLGVGWLGESEEQSVSFALPGEEVVESVREYCVQIGVALSVSHD